LIFSEEPQIQAVARGVDKAEAVVLVKDVGKIVVDKNAHKYLKLKKCVI